MPVLSTLGAAIANVYGFTSGLIKDQYFNLVSLLLPGNGTNGAQNNTFLDSSTNNFTITRNGDTTQGTFSPFSQTGWGNYFDGSNDYLSIANNSAFNISTGDFTLETWVYINSLPSSGNTEGLVTITNASIVNYSSVTLRMFIDSAAKIVLDAGSSSTGASTPLFNITSANAISLNTFTHIAFVRSGSTFVLYINGKAEVTASSSATLYWDSSKIFNIAADGGGTRPSDGYFSNLRLVTSQALFTGSTVGTTYFTPSIQPLTTTSIGATGSGVAASLTGTVALLTCQANRFRDASSNNLTITANNGAAVTPFSPFAPTSSYSAAAVGGSGYFDGSGDYLSIADNAAFTMGTSDFTVEAWVYCTATDFASSRYIIAQRNASADTSISFAMNFVGGGARKVRLLCFDSGGASYEAACATDVLNLNEWTHIAGVRNGATLRIYVNGVQQGTANISTASLVDSDGSVAIGRLGDANFYYWLGYISNVRITKGGCLYPSGTQFTPPTAPLTTTVSAGTVSLLTNFTNAGVVDATAKNVLETEGNAQISTAQSKWGGGSISIPKTSTDYLKSNLPVTDLCAFGSGDFVIEFWLRLAAVPGSGQIGIVYDSRPSATNGAYAMLYIDNATLKYYVSSADRITGSTLSINNWYYIAVARASGSTRLYIDGTQSGSTYPDSTVYLNGSQRPLIGTSGNSPSSSEAINGFIDDLRVTKGSARGYSGSTITVPSGPFPQQ